MSLDKANRELGSFEEGMKEGFYGFQKYILKRIEAGKWDSLEDLKDELQEEMIQLEDFSNKNGDSKLQ